MKIVVVRHAEKSEIKPNPITEAGRACALEAGAWLQAQGVRPVLVGFTEKLRTRETVKAILSTYGLERAGVAQLPVGSMPANLEGWTRAVERITEVMRTRGLHGDVILGVHGTTQDFLVRELGARKPPKGFRGATFVVDVGHGVGRTSRCQASWSGQPEKLP